MQRLDDGDLFVLCVAGVMCEESARCLGARVGRKGRSSSRVLMVLIPERKH